MIPQTIIDHLILLESAERLLDEAIDLTDMTAQERAAWLIVQRRDRLIEAVRGCVRAEIDQPDWTL